jgi:hypothetical protein
MYLVFVLGCVKLILFYLLFPAVFITGTSRPFTAVFVSFVDLITDGPALIACLATEQVSKPPEHHGDPQPA